MKRYLFLILATIVFPLVSHSAYVPGSQQFMIANQVFNLTDSDWGSTAGKYVLLNCTSWDGTTNRTNGGCYNSTNASNTLYSVPAALTLTILGVRLINGNGTACNLQLDYADSGQAGQGSASAPTNPVYQTGGAGNGMYVGPAVAGNVTEHISRFSIPATKQPGVNNTASPNGGCWVEMFGKLN